MPRLPLVALLVALFVSVSAAQAKITNPVTLEQVVKEQPLIFTAKVTEFLPDKPGMVFAPADRLRGEFPFDRVPVNLSGDKEAKDEKQPAILLERLDKDMPLIVFGRRRGKAFEAVGYTNGTWFRMSGVVEAQEGKEVTRWQFTHCEPYFRRTFKGTTEELIKAVQSGLKGEKLPPYNEKEEPGYGPPLNKSKDNGKEPLVRASNGTSLRAPLPIGVIQLPFLGVIAALAALFPALFGGMALLMRRWVAALSVASAVSILAALVVYFPKWIAWTGVKSLSSLWITAAVLTGLGALWAGHRYRRAAAAGRGEEYQPRYLDRVALAVAVILGAGALCYAYLAKEPIGESPWLEVVLLLVPVAACLCFLLAHWLRTRREPKQVALSAETVGLWAGCFACAVAGAAFLGGPRGPAIIGPRAGVRVTLVDQPLWVFEPKENGQIFSTPCVTPERIYVAVHHRQGFSQDGRVYALDPATGGIVWEFDDDGALKPLFSSPAYADGRLYFGEGYHTDRDSRLFCLDAATGKKLWVFQTESHTESTPAVAEGKVVFGAGDDGLYCLNATTGEKLWQFPPEGGLHVDSNPLIHNGRVYSASGKSKRSTNTRIFCLDLNTGKELWGEKAGYSAWGSPTAAGKQVFFPTGNGTFTEERSPVAGLVLCRNAETGQPIWERALANSIVARPAVDRYQVYVGCKDGNVYALDRQTGELVWSTTLQAPVLAAPVVDTSPAVHTGEVLYVIGSTGLLQAMAPADGSLLWAISFRDLIGVPYAMAMSTPVVVREPGDGKRARRVYVGLGFGQSAVATPTARLYCFREISE